MRGEVEGSDVEGNAAGCEKFKGMTAKTSLYIIYNTYIYNIYIYTDKPIMLNSCSQKPSRLFF